MNHLFPDTYCICFNKRNFLYLLSNIDVYVSTSGTDNSCLSAASFHLQSRQLNIRRCWLHTNGPNYTYLKSRSLTRRYLKHFFVLSLVTHNRYTARPILISSTKPRILCNVVCSILPNTLDGKIPTFNIINYTWATSRVK